MNAQNPAKTPVESTDSKQSLRDRVKQSPVASKTVKVLAGVGTAAIVVTGVALVKNRKTVKVEATLPSVDVTTDA